MASLFLLINNFSFFLAMKICYKKYKTTEEEKTIEIGEEFFGRFYDSNNSEFFIGSFIKNHKIFYIEIRQDEFTQYTREIITGGNDSITLDIKSALNKYNFQNFVSKDFFMEKLSSFSLSSDTIYQYTLSVPGDPTSASCDPKPLS